jgi:hypothetical protein
MVIVLERWNFKEISQTLSGFIAQLLISVAVDLEIW